MAAAVHKPSFPASMGMGPTQIPSTRDYTSAALAHRAPPASSNSNGAFASPTESEFSEVYDGSDSVK